MSGWRLLPLLSLLSLGGCWVGEERIANLQDRDHDGFLPIELGGTDCGPDDPAVNPDAQEICGDNLDNNCDGFIDDRGLGSLVWYADEDGDGFGREATAIRACTAPLGHVDRIGDCDDADPTRHPDADDLCDGIDNDCDTFIDEDAVPLVQYRDNDGDLRGVFTSQQRSCSILPGYVFVAGDCDDTDATIFEGAVDNNCDGVDNDCDGAVDEDAEYHTYFPDIDQDGWGDSQAQGIFSCTVLSALVTRQGDCDDRNSTLNAGQAELCDGIDNNCSGQIDENLPVTLFYVDGDGDGYGDPATGFITCGATTGVVLDGNDCDDTDPTLSPAALDLCDGVDDNCDGVIDDGATFSTWYRDEDGDNWGLTTANLQSCAPVPGYVTDPGDCDDTATAVHPGVPEICDDVDNDCNGLPDDGLPFTLYFPDTDGDGYGTGGGTLECSPPVESTTIGGDCDDTNDRITTRQWFFDGDEDGYGVPPALSVCLAPPSYVSSSADCDDSTDLAHPNGVEVCGDGLDNDCFSLTDCAWEGTTQATQADLHLVPQPGWTLGVFNDINDDEIGDVWVKKPTATHIFYGGNTPISLSTTPDWVLPSGCLPSQLRDISGTTSVLCRYPGRLEIYGEGAPVPEMVIASPEAGFGSTWAVSISPKGLWTRSDEGLYFFLLQPGTFDTSDANQWARMVPISFTVAPTDQDQEALFVVTQGGELLLFYDLPPGEFSTGDALQSFPPPVGTSLAVHTTPVNNRDVLQIQRTDTAGPLLSSTRVFDPYPLGSDPLNDGRAATSFPNEEASILAVTDSTDDGELDWMFDVGSSFRRVGFVYNGERPLSYSTDVDAWFVDGTTGGSLTYLSTADFNGDGTLDLAFKNDAGELLIFHRQLE